MCFCGDDDYNPRQRYRRQPSSLETSQRQKATAYAAQSHGWSDETGMRSNPSQQSLRRKDSYFEPGLAHALVGLPDSDFRAVYDPDRDRQQRILVSQPRFTTDYPQQRQTGTRGVVCEQPSTTEAMAMVYQDTRNMPWIVHQHPGVSRHPDKAAIDAGSSKTAPSMPSSVHLIRRDSNGVSEFGSDDEYDRSDLGNYTVSPITTIASPSPTKKAKPNVRNRHGYGWNGAF
ncbi:hypothetical protein F5Y06DRAFT_259038 [Hypoxylon sp. FL0890]|nr:hypothetical protein F5Y06DRAFT_259038 [Hypoxylon sp. FL0890]